MPLSDAQRSEYQRRSGLTDSDLEEQVGRYVSASSEPESDVALRAVRQLMADTLIISAKYHAISAEDGGDARRTVPDSELDTDRGFLQEIMAPEFRFTSPVGATSDREITINTMLSGTIRPREQGKGGYESTDLEFTLNGDTALLTSTVHMNATGLAVTPGSSEVTERDLSGSFRQVHTFTRTTDWQIISTQMTPVEASGLELVGEFDQPEA